MIRDFYRGFGYVARGFRMLRQPGLRRYVVLPLLVNLLVFGAGSYFGFSAFDHWLATAFPGWLEWLRWLLLPLMAIAFLIVAYYGFTLIANLIASPFNATLSEKVEAKLGDRPGDAGATTLTGIASGSITSVASELRKLTYLTVWAIPLLLLFLIPGINLLAPLLWGLFGVWMLALEYADYPMGNHGMTFSEEKSLLRKKRGLALGFGTAILLMTLVPVLNFFAMPTGVIGATIMWVERLRDDLD